MIGRALGQRGAEASARFRRGRWEECSGRACDTMVAAGNTIRHGVARTRLAKLECPSRKAVRCSAIAGDNGARYASLIGARDVTTQERRVYESGE